MILGVVGKPSSGKSSFFKAATMIDVKISPVPFTTIKPNIGFGHVIIDCVEKDFGKKCNPKHGHCKNGKRFVPIKLVDVAGLVPGAHEGRGMGNQFLDDLRQASALIHVVDASGMTDWEGNPTTGHDPAKDVEFLENELDYWFASIVEKILQKIPKIKSKYELLEILKDQLSGLEISESQIENVLEKFSPQKILEFASELRKVSKPIMIAANKIDLTEAQKNFPALKEKFSNIIPTSAEAEITLKKAAEKNLIDYVPGNKFTISGSLDEKQKHALEIIRNKVIDKFGSTGVQDCLNKTVFDFLNYVAVYPVADANKLTDSEGNILPDVFLVSKGTTLKEFAFKIHTTMGEKFIAGIDARTKKKLSADYQLKNNDVVEIAFAK